MKNIDKALQQRLRNDAKGLVEEVNGMKYETSRKKKAELMRSELAKHELICGAIKGNGKICAETPVEGKNRCRIHGGLSNGAITEEGRAKSLANLNPRAHLIHGMYSKFVMTVEEDIMYCALMNHCIETYDLDPINVVMLDRGIRNLILNQRKEIAEEGEQVDESNSYNDYDTKFLRYMQALGFDRKFNVSKEHKDNDKGVNLNMLFDMGDSV